MTLKKKSGSKNVVENVFQRVLDFGSLSQIYTGERKIGKGKMNTCVSVESMNAQIIADALENGFSYSHATEMVNISRANQGLQHLVSSKTRMGKISGLCDDHIEKEKRL